MKFQFPGNASDPKTTFDQNLPVIYWIHGGGFEIVISNSHHHRVFMILIRFFIFNDLSIGF